MSSILKALEKAEESHSVRRDGGAGGFKKSRERRRPWVLPAAVLGGAAFAALATFAAMGGFSRSAGPVAQVDAVAAPAKAEVTAPPQQVMLADENAAAAALSAAPQGVADAAATEALPVPPPEPAPVSKPDMDAVAKRVTGGAGRVVRSTPVRLAAASAAPAPAAPAKGTPQQTAQARVQPVAAQPAAAPKVAASAARQQGFQATVQPAAVQTAAVAEAAAPAKPAKTRPELRVTGIAWQKDSALSGAIVNGRMLQQGGVVDGYKVEQILEEKVIFSGSGDRVEVPLSAGQ